MVTFRSERGISKAVKRGFNYFFFLVEKSGVWPNVKIDRVVETWLLIIPLYVWGKNVSGRNSPGTLVTSGSTINALDVFKD